MVHPGKLYVLHDIFGRKAHKESSTNVNGQNSSKNEEDENENEKNDN